MPIILGPILDSAGRPANGYLRVRASHPYPIDAGLITTALHTATVTDGQFENTGVSFALPPTPEGVWVRVEEDFDGEQILIRGVTVPDVPQITYQDLIFNYAGWGDVDGGNPDGPAYDVFDGGEF